MMKRNPMDRRGRRYLVDPITGKRLTEVRAIARVEDLYRTAHRQASVVRQAYNVARRGAKLPETRARHAAALERARRELRRLERAAEMLQRHILRTYPVRLPRQRKEAVTKPKRRRVAEPEPELEEVPEGLADEWELGVEYRPSPERKRQGKGWPVDVNVRVRRNDGTAMDRGQALSVIGYWIRTGVVRQGYDVHAIDWRTPGKSWSTGDRVDAGDNLRGPLIAALDTKGFRLGAVDE